MGLPYEKQILKLLQELSHYQIVMRHCRQEKAKYTDEIEKTCSEIELARQKGCSAMGYYLEFIIMEEILELLDQPEICMK